LVTILLQELLNAQSAPLVRIARIKQARQ